MGNASPTDRGLTHDPAQGGLETPPRGTRLEWSQAFGEGASDVPACMCATRGPGGAPPREFEIITMFLQESVGSPIGDESDEVQYKELLGYGGIQPVLWRSQVLRGTGWNQEKVEYWWCEVVLQPGGAPHRSAKPLRPRQGCFRVDQNPNEPEKKPWVHGYLLPAATDD